MTRATSPIDTPAALAPLGRRPTPSVTLHPATPVEHLGEAIAELASRIHAATYELLVMLREFDAKDGWGNGFLSCAHWLHWRTGIDLGAAREKVRVAKALADLPLLSAALQRGEVSYAKVRAVTRVATPANEAQLLDIAWAGTAAHVERVARAWRRCDRVAAARQADHRHLHRAVTTWVDDDGMLVIRGRLTPEQGAVVRRALEAAADRLFQEARHAAPPDRVVDEVTAEQRRADALALLAEAAMAGDLDRGNSGDRYQVVLHVDASANRVEAVAEAYAEIGHDGQAVVEVGDLQVDVSAEASRRIACDAAVVLMQHDAQGNVLDVGRKTRTIPPAIRRALTARDTQCQFPGCTARRCDAHHLVHWADGGATALDNLALMCRRHHRLVHEGGYTVGRDPGGATTFIRPNGVLVDALPTPPRWERSQAHPLGPTTDRLAAVGIDIGPHTAPCWDGTPFNVGYVIDALRGNEPLPPRAHPAQASKTFSTSSP